MDAAEGSARPWGFASAHSLLSRGDVDDVDELLTSSARWRPSAAARPPLSVSMSPLSEPLSASPGDAHCYGAGCFSGVASSSTSRLGASPPPYDYGGGGAAAVAAVTIGWSPSESSLLGASPSLASQATFVAATSAWGQPRQRPSPAADDDAWGGGSPGGGGGGGSALMDCSTSELASASPETLLAGGWGGPGAAWDGPAASGACTMGTPPRGARESRSARPSSSFAAQSPPARAPSCFLSPEALPPHFSGSFGAGGREDEDASRGRGLFGADPPRLLPGDWPSSSAVAAAAEEGARLRLHRARLARSPAARGTVQRLCDEAQQDWLRAVLSAWTLVAAGRSGRVLEAAVPRTPFQAWLTWQLDRHTERARGERFTACMGRRDQDAVLRECFLRWHGSGGRCGSRDHGSGAEELRELTERLRQAELEGRQLRVSEQRLADEADALRQCLDSERQLCGEVRGVHERLGRAEEECGQLQAAHERLGEEAQTLRWRLEQAEAECLSLRASEEQLREQASRWRAEAAALADRCSRVEAELARRSGGEFARLRALESELAQLQGEAFAAASAPSPPAVAPSMEPPWDLGFATAAAAAIGAAAAFGVPAVGAASAGAARRGPGRGRRLGDVAGAVAWCSRTIAVEALLRLYWLAWSMATSGNRLADALLEQCVAAEADAVCRQTLLVWRFALASGGLRPAARRRGPLEWALARDCEWLVWAVLQAWHAAVCTLVQRKTLAVRSPPGRRGPTSPPPSSAGVNGTCTGTGGVDGGGRQAGESSGLGIRVAPSLAWECRARSSYAPSPDSAGTPRSAWEWPPTHAVALPPPSSSSSSAVLRSSSASALLLPRRTSDGTAAPSGGFLGGGGGRRLSTGSATLSVGSFPWPAPQPQAPSPSTASRGRVVVHCGPARLPSTGAMSGRASVGDGGGSSGGGDASAGR